MRAARSKMARAAPQLLGQLGRQARRERLRRRPHRAALRLCRWAELGHLQGP